MMRIGLIILLVLWTTARHEASHAAMALLEGAEIQEMRLLPGIHPELGFYFGYVKHSGDPTWRIDAAPFIADAVVVLAASALLRRMRRESRYRIPIIFFGLISPLADLGYNYQGGLWRSGTDVAGLFQRLPNAPVHIFFIVAIGLTVMALRATRKVVAPEHPAG